MACVPVSARGFSKSCQFEQFCWLRLRVHTFRERVQPGGEATRTLACTKTDASCCGQCGQWDKGQLRIQTNVQVLATQNCLALPSAA